MSLRTIPIRRAGNRHTLFMGGDREMVMFSGLLAAVLAFAAMDGLALAAGSALWFGSLWALRKMAKSDPLMRPIYLKSRQYQAYYPARASWARNNTRSQWRHYQ